MSAITAATMAIAAMVNRSGLVASGKRGGLDSTVEAFKSLAAMRCILAADSMRAPRGLQTVPPPTMICALNSNLGEQFWLRKSDAAFANARSSVGEIETQCRAVESTVPSDHLATGIRNTVSRSRVSSDARIGEPGRSAPQVPATVCGTKNIRWGCQCPS